MYNERKKGIACSVALHLIFFLLLFFGLPSFMLNEPPPEPAAITVELLPISKISNVKPSEGSITEKPKQAEPKPAEEQKKPSPPVKTAEASAPPPPPEPKPEIKKPEPKPEIKKPEPKPEPKKPEVKPDTKKAEPKKKADESLDAILKAVKETAQKEKDNKEPTKEKPAPAPKAISNRFDSTMPMSISEKDAIMGQLARCWNPPAGAKNAHELVVVINAEFNTDGSYIRAEIADVSRSRYNSDTFFRAAADAALRAVRQCSPLKNLDPNKYDVWRVMELHFDPRDMLQ